MLRNRLREMELKITELADYLQISRPTMYKFIEYYDASEFDLINNKVLKLFNYISEHELIGKKNVVNYILTNFADVQELGLDEETVAIKKIKKYITDNPESKKSQFLCSIVNTNSLDETLSYLADVLTLLGKTDLTDSEKLFLQPYLTLKNEIQKEHKNGESILHY